ncbi:hypothetical protein MCOR27_003662 [Pyricularia oryzae]|uniref:Chromo domain-containing protein n=4 Tax=Pyricularia TaxID=48558 RepID=A0ABQ8NXU4_PYRGI|nr:uncharacterized protein MGG_09873 [Pyricularia oryzae 70-15]ELQ45069.1 hypothetical protein OOU_Y34scaffold00021g9 [Pyricularia oryzae Y34]KAH8846453.1 hypothetical protein MCOR01_003652 [Pyricularia oryzae]KAI6303688.1 hypothetical protein MCOR33_001209 [Pyricularia grisea]EHA47994.1 hypothetical protein MGG_09873 [Pyricularia oryzae 70-15]KAH9432029.1 hypothetical protein MCOR02_006735 [Pyricularia oryzae]
MADSDAETATQPSTSSVSSLPDMKVAELHTQTAAVESSKARQTLSPSASKRLRNPASSSSLPNISTILKRHASDATTNKDCKGSAGSNKISATSAAKRKVSRKTTSEGASISEPQPPSTHPETDKNDRLSEQEIPAVSNVQVSEVIPVRDTAVNGTGHVKINTTGLGPAETTTAFKDVETAADSNAILYASVLDEEAVDPCELEVESCPHLHIEAIVGHRFVQGVGIEVLAQWGQDHNLPNSWEPESIMHADARDLLLEYWETTPGGRLQELRGTGHENDVFALHRYEARPNDDSEGAAPKSKKIKLMPNKSRSAKPHKALLVVEVEYCGYRGTTWVPDKLLSEDLPVLMAKYWALAGGRPAGF